ncbi:MAG: 23S rRNA (pseudouridine(1915)-N(3))-methyltransferase RlmH [Acutalibacteraceae bacterium]|nr:23S rRNA (pseudouridine(1915)-N(3))-methyltransferase RlmH [Acutalibacteraceae bacterium]
MVKFKIIAVGKIKEKFYKDACEEYIKRLNLYSKTEVTEISEYKCLSDKPSPVEIDNILINEGKSIISAIPKNYAIIPMCIEGKKQSSLEFSQLINNFTVNGYAGICFIIGSSYGLSSEVKSISDFKLSMSDMTFPHMLARVMLLEQIYRSMNILNNGKYHK